MFVFSCAMQIMYHTFPVSDGEASPKKKKPKHGGKKKRQREISPIEWDRQSEESEENDITDASEESEEDEEKSVKSGEGGKSDSETERRSEYSMTWLKGTG